MKIDERVVMFEDEIETLEQKIDELEREISDLQDEVDGVAELQNKMDEIETWIDKKSENTFDESEVERAFQLCWKNGITLEFVATIYVNRVLAELKKIIDE